MRILNAISRKAKINRLFFKLYNSISADHKNLFLHSKIRWVSRGEDW